MLGELFSAHNSLSGPERLEQANEIDFTHSQYLKGLNLVYFVNSSTYLHQFFL